MVTTCIKPRSLYRPRDPRDSDLWRLLDEQFDSFREVYDERYQEKYGFWRPVEEACSPVGHRQVVLTIPKRLRVHTRFDRGLLGKLSYCVWLSLQAEVRRLLGRDDVVPGKC